MLSRSRFVLAAEMPKPSALSSFHDCISDTVTRLFLPLNKCPSSNFKPAKVLLMQATDSTKVKGPISITSAMVIPKLPEPGDLWRCFNLFLLLCKATI